MARLSFSHPGLLEKGEALQRWLGQATPAQRPEFEALAAGILDPDLS